MKKNDHVQNPKLVRLHPANMLPKYSLLDEGEQMRRDLLIQRVKLGMEISSVKNSIIGYLIMGAFKTVCPNAAKPSTS